MEHPHHAYPRIVAFLDHHEVAAVVALAGGLVLAMLAGTLLSSF